jgi:hypothetical protein
MRRSLPQSPAPREETVAYLRRQEDEEKLLDYITTKFVFPEEGMLEEEVVASVLESAPEVEEEPLMSKVRKDTRVAGNKPIIKFSSILMVENDPPGMCGLSYDRKGHTYQDG